MARALTNATETGVGIVCLLGAAFAWRRRLLLAAVALSAAGAAAATHEVVALATR